MTEYWKTIATSRYKDGAITAEQVQSYVPKKLTQAECDSIINPQ